MSTSSDKDDEPACPVAEARRFAIDTVQARLEEIGRLVAGTAARDPDDVTGARVDPRSP